MIHDHNHWHLTCLILTFLHSYSRILSTAAGILYDVRIKHMYDNVQMSDKTLLTGVLYIFVYCIKNIYIYYRLFLISPRVPTQPWNLTPSWTQKLAVLDSCVVFWEREKKCAVFLLSFDFSFDSCTVSFQVRLWNRKRLNVS